MINPDIGLTLLVSGVTVVVLIVCITLAVTARPGPRTLDWYRRNEGYCSYCGNLMILRVQRHDRYTVKYWICKNGTGARDMEHDCVVLDTLNTPQYDRLTGSKLHD